MCFETRDKKILAMSVCHSVHVLKINLINFTIKLTLLTT